MTPEEFARQLEGQELPPEIYDAADVVYLTTPRVVSTCSHGLPVGAPCGECAARVKAFTPPRRRFSIKTLIKRIYSMGIER